MKIGISVKARIIGGLVVFGLTVVLLSMLGISRVSLQSLTSAMRVIFSTSFFSALGGMIAGQIFFSGLRKRSAEKKAKKAEEKQQHLENEKPPETLKIE